jgi:hypothetical protein
MTRFTIVLVIHIILCIQALRRIWHAQDEDGIGWQAAWSFIVLLTPLLGPVMYFGMAAPPDEKPESERMRRRGLIGNFSGLYDSIVTEKPPPAPPPKKPPPPDDGGDSRAGSMTPAAVDSKSDLQREMEEARRLEQLERDRRRQRQREEKQ